ncbi:(2Fe-2S)-binding protein [Sulfitobacter mediterraneus]|uniref:(2Fe-2S)-binding protein n=1 Tax=Sulfitobacter mediterraneus TaxID=83219 RepID=UPI0021A91FEB|nr:(2Fe-2S)-binding protein [Sulfitobacter mediterraneus]UWR13367.1 (2Fe-2S)-binding protein [Sulfitobacter mediterraneus]
MKTASPFLELESGPRVDVTWGGATLSLPDGANLAAALLAAGVDVFRHTPVSGAPRAPFCMMGACFDCLVEINGVTRQACMLEVIEGMVMTRPREMGAHADET